MSTKNLSRTVIEGGRCEHYKADVYARARQERAAAKRYLKAVRVDPECGEESAPPQRQPETPCFADKLNPIYRFLDSRVGDSWSEVRSELFSRFDTRTTPGRHVLFDHLLRDVCESGDPKSPERRFARYFIDAEGRLAKEHRERVSFGQTMWRGGDVLAAWLGARKIGRMGERFAWFVPVDERVRAVYVHAKYGRGDLLYAALDEHGSIIRDPQPPYVGRYSIIPRPAVVRRSTVRFRQCGQLGARDEAYFRSLPKWVQDEILALAPANV